MTEVYSEITGNKKYSVSEHNSENITMYDVTIYDDNRKYTVHDFTSDKNQAIEFAECLVRNYVSGIHIKDVAYDYIS